MNTLKLLPEQVAKLNAEANELNEEYFRLIEEEKKEERKISRCDMQGITDTSDNTTFLKLMNVKNRVKTIKSYLNHYELVDKYDSEKISIGTEFTVYMDFGHNDIEQGTYRLVHTNVCSSYEDNYISIDCKLGEAVLNKKVGDQISYLAPNKNVVKGVILAILPEKTIEQPKVKAKSIF